MGSKASTISSKYTQVYNAPLVHFCDKKDILCWLSRAYYISNFIIWNKKHTTCFCDGQSFVFQLALFFQIIFLFSIKRIMSYCINLLTNLPIGRAYRLCIYLVLTNKVPNEFDLPIFRSYGVFWKFRGIRRPISYAIRTSHQRDRIDNLWTNLTCQLAGFIDYAYILYIYIYLILTNKVPN